MVLRIVFCDFFGLEFSGCCRYNPTPPLGTQGHRHIDSEEAAASAATCQVSTPQVPWCIRADLSSSKLTVIMCLMCQGHLQQAGFDGSGIPEGSQSDFDTQFRYEVSDFCCVNVT